MKITSSHLRIERMRIYAYHGALPHERKAGNEYLVSLEVHFDAARAMMADTLADTINYADLYTLVEEEMASPSDLIEHVCGRILARLMETYPQVGAATVEIDKCTPPIHGFNAESVRFSASVSR